MQKKLLSVPYLVWVVGFTVIPLIFIFGKALTTSDGSFTLSNITAIFDSLHRKALFLSLELAFICTLICIVLAYPLALIMRNSRMNQQSVILLILVLPMWMNFILRILALQMIISNNGILNLLLTKLGLEPLQLVNTPAAIVLGMVYDYLPYMILPVMNAITAIDENLIEASRDLGAGRWHIFRKVIFPLSLPGVGSGITMVFVPAMTEFVLANILGGGKILLLGNVIEQEFMVTMDWNLGAGLSVALMLFVLVTSFLFGGKNDSETVML